MKWRVTFIVAAVLFSTLGMGSLSAQELRATSRSAGMGEALTAGSAGSSSLWHNPAGIVSAIMYAAEAGYVYDGRSEVNAITANVVDTKSNPSFGAAMAFVYETGNPDDGLKHEGMHFRGGLAFPLLDGMVKLGAGVNYSQVKKDGAEVLAALTLDAGLMVQPTSALSFGVVGLNLVNGGYDEALPRGVALGAALSSWDYGIHLSGDLLFNLSAAHPESARTWRLGAEYMIAGLFPVRGGYSYDELVQHSRLSMGAGFRDKNAALGFDASYQHNLDDSGDRVFAGSLSVYF